MRAVEEHRRVGPFGDGNFGDIDPETIEYGAPLADLLERSTSCFPKPHHKTASSPASSIEPMEVRGVHFSVHLDGNQATC